MLPVFARRPLTLSDDNGRPPTTNHTKTTRPLVVQSEVVFEEAVNLNRVARVAALPPQVYTAAHAMRP